MQSSDDNDEPQKYYWVPPLIALCIQKLISYPEQISGVALTYAPSPQFDILKTLIPSKSFSSIDPRLWATLIQIYGTSLPSIFTTCFIPFHDVRLALLQRVPSSPTFSLITILELPGCTQLTDDSASLIRSLHSLTAFDASDTAFSSWGLRRLVMPILKTDEEDSLEGGLRHLRILRLRNCKGIDESIFKHLRKLSLLSVIDLRGTGVDPGHIPAPFEEWSSSCLEQSSLTSLYHPTPLHESMSSLGNLCPDLHSSSSVFNLHIDRFKQHQSSLMYHKPRLDIAVEIQDRSFTFTSSTMLSHLPQNEDDHSTSKRDSDYMLHAAAEESRQLASRQQIRRFYAPILLPGRSTKGYSAEKYYADYSRNRLWPKFVDADRPLKKRKLSQKVHSLDESDPLMLYHHPPPWSSFTPDRIVDPVPTRRPAATLQTARVSKSFPKLQMIENLKVARKSRISMATFDGVTPSVDVEDVNLRPSTSLQGRNPFRRLDSSALMSTKHPSADTVSSLASGNRSTATTDLLALATHNNNVDSGSSPARPLKPISSVPIPELPVEEMQKLKESMMKKPRTSLPGASSSSTANEPSRRKSLPASGRTGDIRKIMQKMASNNSPGDVRALSESLSSAQQPKEKRTVGFSWKTWGAQS